MIIYLKSSLFISFYHSETSSRRASKAASGHRTDIVMIIAHLLLGENYEMEFTGQNGQVSKRFVSMSQKEWL